MLAAGGGTRMKSAKSKLLHEVGGHTLLSYALAAATEIGPDEVVVVVGHQRDQVQAHLAEIAPHVRTAVQEPQLGTGHAVQCGLAALADLPSLPREIVVTYGDVPDADQRDPRRSAGRPSRPGRRGHRAHRRRRRSDRLRPGGS